MKFDWLSYLRLAKSLSEDAQSALAQQANPERQTSNFSSICEAKLRCSISRAYYSVFCLARNHLRDAEFNVTVAKRQSYDVNIHQYVIEEFKGSRDTDRRNIGICLERLRLDRNKADYDDSIDFRHLIAKANGAISAAERVIGLLKKLE